MRTAGTAAFVSALLLESVSASSVPRPTIPYESHGVCPFECCEYRTWTVESDTGVLAEREDRAPVVFRVRKGESVRGLTGVVVTTKFGRAEVRRPTTIGSERQTALLPGDEVVILHYAGEGYWRFWVKGSIDQDQLPESGQQCSNDSGEAVECAVQIIEQPENVWWSKVRARHGREGWTRQMDHFGNVDACG